MASEDAWFREWTPVEFGEPLRQGDVIEAIDENAEPWDAVLLVITADCDLANAKHFGRVTCIPLLSADQYLLTFAVPKVRDRLIRKHVSDFETLCKASGRSPSASRLTTWPQEATNTEIAEALGLYGDAATAAHRCADAIRLATDEPTSIAAAVEALCASAALSPNPPNSVNYRKGLNDTLTSHFAQPPGDALFVSAYSHTDDLGYFAYLRHIEQVMEPTIATRPKHEEARYRRVSRLTDRFTHAIVQRFAAVFASIGLPTEYEELRNLYSEQLRERMS